VVMEEGAAFRGRIDMSERGEKAPRPKPMAVAESPLAAKGEPRLPAADTAAKETAKA
jgi:cytoskeletal protein CcmA (bactofilin family)